MNWKRTIALIILFSFTSYFLRGENLEDSASTEIKTSFQERAPASIKITKKENLNSESELEKSGLAAEKVRAINQLNEFHASNPSYTEDNILKRQAMLDELIKNPRETVQIFSKLMRNSKDDGLKSFLLNLTMNSKLEDDEKAQVFLARLKAGATISKEGLVPDEHLSFMVSISHLRRIENEEAREFALNELKQERSLISSIGFRQLYKDYFNEAL
jgi:hypothetical protein